MAQNRQITGNMQGLQYQLHDGDGVENERNYPAVEAHELERPIIAPGNNDYQLILAGFKAHIPEQVKNGADNVIMGVQTREINRRHQYDEGLQRARLDVTSMF